MTLDLLQKGWICGSAALKLSKVFSQAYREEQRLQQLAGGVFGVGEVYGGSREDVRSIPLLEMAEL